VVVARPLVKSGRRQRDRGVLRRYLQNTSRYSRAQVTHLVARWRGKRLAALALAMRYRALAQPFARKYMAADVALLVEMNMGTPSSVRSVARPCASCTSRF